MEQSERVLIMTRRQYSTSFRLSPMALALLKKLAAELGLSQASVIEMAIRKLAKAQ